jgi:hypothetical protein
VAARQRRPTAPSGRRGGPASKSKIGNGRASFLPNGPIHLKLYQIGGLYHLSTHFLSAKASAAADELFRGKSTQLPYHKQVTHNHGLFSVKPSQGWSRLIKHN